MDRSFLTKNILTIVLLLMNFSRFCDDHIVLKNHLKDKRFVFVDILVLIIESIVVIITRHLTELKCLRCFN